MCNQRTQYIRLPAGSCQSMYTKGCTVRQNVAPTSSSQLLPYANMRHTGRTFRACLCSTESTQLAFCYKVIRTSEGTFYCLWDKQTTVIVVEEFKVSAACLLPPDAAVVGSNATRGIGTFFLFRVHGV